MTILTLTTGTAFIMWLGEQISERGIGNGISLIIFAGIVVNLPHAVLATVEDLKTGNIGMITLILLLAIMVLVVAAIVFVERAQRRIPVQYARRVVGRRTYGGLSTHLPLRLNTGGVIPVIFASSILSIFQTLGQIPWVQKTPWARDLIHQFDFSMPLHHMLYFLFIIFFCYFYVSIIFNPMDTADNLQKFGGFIPGIRPGRRTAEFIDNVLTRLTFVGSIYLALIALLPTILISGFNFGAIPLIGQSLEYILPDFLSKGLNVKFVFGGTSLLIVVGVAMDTVQQVESQLIMRHYEGFLKGARIKGRRG
jgi:preprotein translocase subunit SecY